MPVSVPVQAPVDTVGNVTDFSPAQLQHWMREELQCPEAVIPTEHALHSLGNRWPMKSLWPILASHVYSSRRINTIRHNLRAQYLKQQGGSTAVEDSQEHLVTVSEDEMLRRQITELSREAMELRQEIQRLHSAIRAQEVSTATQRSAGLVLKTKARDIADLRDRLQVQTDNVLKLGVTDSSEIALASAPDTLARLSEDARRQSLDVKGLISAHDEEQDRLLLEGSTRILSNANGPAADGNERKKASGEESKQQPSRIILDDDDEDDSDEEEGDNLIIMPTHLKKRGSHGEYLKEGSSIASAASAVEANIPARLYRQLHLLRENENKRYIDVQRLLQETAELDMEWRSALGAASAGLDLPLLADVEAEEAAIDVVNREIASLESSKQRQSEHRDSLERRRFELESRQRQLIGNVKELEESIRENAMMKAKCLKQQANLRHRAGLGLSAPSAATVRNNEALCRDQEEEFTIDDPLSQEPNLMSTVIPHHPQWRQLIGDTVAVQGLGFVRSQAFASAIGDPSALDAEGHKVADEYDGNDGDHTYRRMIKQKMDQPHQGQGLDSLVANHDLQYNHAAVTMGPRAFQASGTSSHSAMDQSISVLQRALQTKWKVSLHRSMVQGNCATNPSATDLFALDLVFGVADGMRHRWQAATVNTFLQWDECLAAEANRASDDATNQSPSPAMTKTPLIINGRENLSLLVDALLLAPEDCLHMGERFVRHLPQHSLDNELLEPLAVSNGQLVAKSEASLQAITEASVEAGPKLAKALHAWYQQPAADCDPQTQLEGRTLAEWRRLYRAAVVRRNNEAEALQDLNVTTASSTAA
eukprot:Clim_evm36s198 gene=Clim_evmTU36s198